MTDTVGFIGLGNMGGPMALNLVKAGFELVVHDINPARVAPLVAAGATVEASAEAVAAKCHRTICMVETTDQAESVILGEKGIIQSAKQGDIVLCMSTIDPLAARRFAECLGAKGVAMLDAPVSGGTHGAAAATLSVIVGGPAETFAASEDLFRAMGKNVFHVGGLGHGLAMKLINNMLGQIANVAIAEALVVGKKPASIRIRSTRSCASAPAAACSSRTGCPACWRAILCRGARLTSRTRTKSSKPHLRSSSACRCCSPT